MYVHLLVSPSSYLYTCTGEAVVKAFAVDLDVAKIDLGPPTLPKTIPMNIIPHKVAVFMLFASCFKFCSLFYEPPATLVSRMPLLKYKIFIYNSSCR